MLLCSGGVGAPEVLEDTRTEVPRRLSVTPIATNRPYDLETSLPKTTLRVVALSGLCAPFLRSWSLMECAALAAPRSEGPVVGFLVWSHST